MAYFDNQSVHIYYDIEGPHDFSNTIVLVHGLGGSSSAFLRLRNILHNLNYRTLAIDLRGHGLTDRKKDTTFLTLDHLVYDLSTVLKKEHISNPIILGYSLGGFVAVTYAARYTCKDLILISTAPHLGLAHTLYIKTFAIKIANSLLPFVPTVGKMGQVNYELCDGNRNIDIKRFAYDIWNVTLSSYCYSWHAALQFDVSQYLKDIHCPTLILSGQHDIFVTPSTAHHLHRSIHNSQLHLLNANHSIILNNTNELADKIKIFLKQA